MAAHWSDTYINLGRVVVDDETRPTIASLRGSMLMLAYRTHASLGRIAYIEWDEIDTRYDRDATGRHLPIPQSETFQVSLQLVEFEKTDNGNLKVTLLDEGRQWLADYPNTPFSDLVEHQICNGWSHVLPEQVGALTSSDIIISDTAEFDGMGDLISVGRVYWHPNYAVEDPVETLLEKGFIILTGAE